MGSMWIWLAGYVVAFNKLASQFTGTTVAQLTPGGQQRTACAFAADVLLRRGTHVQKFGQQKSEGKSDPHCVRSE